MGYSIAQCTSLSLKYLKSNTEFNLIMLTSQLQRLSLQSSDAALRYQSQMARIQRLDQDEDSTIDTSDLWSQLQLEYSVQTARIQAQEKILEQRKIHMETQIKEIEAMAESFDGLVDKGIKESISSKDS